MKKISNRKRSKKKCYIIFSLTTNYKFGAFPYTDEGYEKAKKYVEELSKVHTDEFIIKDS